MATKLSLALITFLLPVSSILATSFADAAHGSTASDDLGLQTGVPYYMVPLPQQAERGVLQVVAPAKLGNEECPSAVAATVKPEYVPIIFTSRGSPWDQSVVIDENTEVTIRFNFTDGSTCSERWGYPFYLRDPNKIDLYLVNLARIYVTEIFRIKKEGSFYSLYSTKIDEEGKEIVYNLVIDYDSKTRLRRLAISTQASPSLFGFVQAVPSGGMLKSVV